MQSNHGNNPADFDQDNKLSMKKLFDPFGPYVPTWNAIFAISSVIAVSIDPLFLYIPILDQGKKCLGIDRNLKTIAVVLRFFVDLSFIIHIVFRIYSPFCASKKFDSVKYSYLNNKLRRIRWSYILIDLLAILPIPQVLILTYFSRVRSFRSLMTSKFINFLVLVQYVPRVLRLYLSCQNLKTTPGLSHDRIIRFGAFLNIVLYIVASHVLGALWYFFSIQRETACWHHACKKVQPEKCVRGSFVCRSNFSSKDISVLSRFCSINPHNTTTFDFGIFADAIQSGILEKTSFFKKFIRCLWWGLRNVSSFGQNLQTSTNEWETCFAASISITALLLFIYLIGNLQMYFQTATARSEEMVQRMRRIEAEIDSWIRSHSLPANEKGTIMQQVQQALENDKGTSDLAILRALLIDRFDRNEIIDGRGIERLECGSSSIHATQVGNMIKEQKAEQWMSRNGIPNEIKLSIMPHIRFALQENIEDVDLKTLLSILPEKHKISLTKHLGFAVLKRVPMLRDLDDNVLENICNYLKPVIYPENSYIVLQGEPLDLMFFVTEGIAWTYTASNCGEMSISSSSSLERGDFYGDKELLQWTLNNASLSNIPISTANVKTHTKVEALALMAKDLRELVSTTSCGPSSSFGTGTIQIKVEKSS